MCYLGNLPVEATSAGPAQLFRLLQSLDPGRVLVIESDCAPSLAARRLAGVRYELLRPLFTRGWYFARTRAPRLFWFMLRANAWLQARRAAALLQGFKPAAIITVHDGFAWITAAALASRLNVPLHLILHDDWFRNIPMAGQLHGKFENYFRQIYRQAGSRLCISPYMETEYARRYGAAGTVLFPIRAEDAPVHDSPPRTDAALRPLTVAFAGNLWHRGNWISLRNLVGALARVGGRLVVFGPTKPEDLARHNLLESNVSVRGFVPDLIQSLRDEADVVFVPMTFDDSERRNMEISFPSKMTEYTATGLALLIEGPAYSSAVRLAQAHPGSAEVVLEQSQEALANAITRLLDPDHREQLGQRASQLGDKFLSFTAGARTFHEAIGRSAPSSPARG